MLLNAWRNSSLNSHKQASCSRERHPVWYLGYSSTEISAAAHFAWKAAEQQGRFSVERNKKPEKKYSECLCTYGCPAWVWGDGRLCAWAPPQQHPPSPDLQQRQSLSLVLTPIRSSNQDGFTSLTQTEGSQESLCLSDLAGWRTATWCQAKTPLLHIITALQDSLCTKSHKCSICRTKREHKNHYFHILIPWKKLPPSTALFSLKGITCIFLHYKKLNLCILPASDKLSHAATDKGCSEIKICDSYKYIMKQLAKHYKN